MDTTETAAPVSIRRSTDPADLPAFMTVLEWRQYLGISRTAAYALIKAGEVPVLKVGRHLRVPRSALKLP